jgi:hypothetical protein
MDITNYFINFCNAAQYVYGGENYIDIYKRVQGEFKKTKTFENKTIFNVDTYDIDEIKRELANVETGIVLNSANFIYNIFEFDKIPFREETRKDLVSWRLQKVFPEDIKLYDYDYFRIDKKRILSILFKKSLREKIEKVFNEYGVNLIYMGNSTIEIINNIKNLKPSPDFFLEIDKELSIVVFRKNSIPFYIRKFRSRKESDIAQEIVKTVNFVKSSYDYVPATYSIISPSDGSSFDPVRELLAELNINELSAELKKNLFLPK